ncbi:acetylcholinesterase-1 [Trichonephila clavipes]|nr:acetylcholinesterase-1 [Trichonephila clavipes]
MVKMHTSRRRRLRESIRCKRPQFCRVTTGLWDNLEGLRWVNKNIKYFGGDLTKITLAGESSGSLSVGLLSISPLAKGLYKRQIMESGAPTFWNAETMKSTNIDFAQQLAKMVNCANDSFTIQNNPKPVVDCLKKVDAMVLSRADSHIFNTSTFDFFPTYGDDIVPENPRIAVSRKNFHCTDLLIGNNKDGGSFLITTGNPQLFGFFGEKDPQINKTTGANIIRGMNQGFPNLEGLIKYYLPDDLEENDYDYIRKQTYTACGDPLFVCTDIYYSEKCAEEGNNVYFYVWRHRPSTTVWAPWMGVAHYTEVQFVFGQPLQNPDRYEASEIQLSVEMIKIWSNFVKTGKPGIPWPKYSQKPHVKYIGPGVGLEMDDTGFHRDNCNYLRPYFGFQST